MTRATRRRTGNTSGSLATRRPQAALHPLTARMASVTTRRLPSAGFSITVRVVVTSDVFSPSLPRLRILMLPRSPFVVAQAQKPVLSLARVAGFGRVEFDGQGPKMYLHNDSRDQTPSSIIQGDYTNVLLQGRKEDVPAERQPQRPVHDNGRAGGSFCRTRRPRAVAHL